MWSTGNDALWREVIREQLKLGGAADLRDPASEADTWVADFIVPIFSGHKEHLRIKV